MLSVDIKKRNMKKTLFLTLALLFSVATYAQNNSVILRETFNSISLPSGWTMTDNSTDNWSISKTNKSGGEANELKFSATPQTVGYSRIITPAVDLTGLSSVTVSFRHFFDKKSTPAMIGVATSSNDGKNWSIAWSQTYNEGGQYNVIKSINTSDIGKNNVKFCIYFQGSSSTINAWYFDDLEIISSVQTDAKAQSIDIADIICAGDNDIIFSIQNTGSDVITSFEAEFNINNQVITERFETELAQYETRQFIFNQAIKLSPNIYNSELRITSVNEQEDQNMVNNNVKKIIRVAMNKVQRLPMFEHFSSSTCASCVSLDGSMKELTAKNTGKYVYTKYVMNWPTYVDVNDDGKPDGDPYYTQEGGVRKNFYNVGSVPFLAFNGKSHSYKAVTQEELDEIYNTPTFIDIKGAFNMDGNNINIIADLMPYVDYNNVKVHISVNEKITTGNTGSNGLKEFHHIMMKMFPDAQGCTTSLKAGEQQRFEFTYDMSNTFVEDINDLEVAVWIQDIETKEIFNSNYLYEYQEHPYPAENLQLINSDNLEIKWDAPEKGTPTSYNILINNELIAENTTELSYTIENPNGLYTVEVIALYDDMKSIGLTGDIIVGCHAPINIKADVETFVQNFDYTHRVTLTWDDVDEAESYNVYVNGDKIGNTTETSYVTGFNENGTYNYTITSNCAEVESEHSEACIVFLEANDIEEKTINLGLYPNPVSDRLFIETDAEIKDVVIYDVYGRRLQSIVNNQQSLSIDVADLKSGIYFIKINTNKGNIVKRIIKN